MLKEFSFWINFNLKFFLLKCLKHTYQKVKFSHLEFLLLPSFLSPISNRLCNLMLLPINLCCELLSTLQSLLTGTFFISWIDYPNTLFFFLRKTALPKACLWFCHFPSLKMFIMASLPPKYIPNSLYRASKI